MSAEVWTAEDHAQMVALAAAGQSARAVGEALGFSRNAVLGRAFRTGVKFHGTKEAKTKVASVPRARKSRQPSARRQFIATRNVEVRRLYLEGLTLSEITRATGVPMGSLGSITKGLPRRRSAGSTARKPDSLKLAALAANMAGAPKSRVAKALGFSEHSYPNWERDAGLVARAEALASRVRAELTATAEAKRALAAFAVSAERARLDAHNAPILAALPERTASMMARRIGGETLEAIGSSYGITRERVRQIEVAARKKGLEVPAAKPLSESSLRLGPTGEYVISEAERERRRASMGERMRGYWAARRAEEARA